MRTFAHCKKAVPGGGLLGAFLGLAISIPAFAAPGDLVKVIRAPQPVSGGMLGIHLAVVGGHLVASSPNEMVQGTPNVGSVCRFRGISGQVGWRLVNPTPDPEGSTDAFGNTLHSFNGKLLIGASDDDLDSTGPVNNAGVAYLVDGSNGALLLTIPNPEPNGGDSFTYGALGNLGDNILIGAPFDDPGGLGNAGTVYLFDGKTGALLLRIPHPEPMAQGDANDVFGRSVAGHEGNILAGAAWDDQIQQSAGGAYLLNGKTGEVMLRIPNPNPQAGCVFGYPVRSFGGKIVISAPWYVSGGKNLGVVYVFDGKTGALLRTIEHPYPQNQLSIDGNRANFGWSLAEHDGFLAVGSHGDDVNGVQDAGSVYVFDLDTGRLVLSIHNPNPVKNDYMGGNVTFHGGQIVTRATGKDFEGLVDAGEVYVFEGPMR